MAERCETADAAGAGAGAAGAGEQDAKVDFSAFIEDIEDEYEFDSEPVIPPAKPEPSRKRPVSPVAAYHKKTLRNSLMMIVVGAIAAVAGAYLTTVGGLSIALAIFISVLGLVLLAVGMMSASKTRRAIHNAQVEFAQDRAMRIYLKCADAGIEGSGTDDDKARILKIAMDFGFDGRNEAVGLYDTGRKLTMKGKRPNPDFDEIR